MIALFLRDAMDARHHRAVKLAPERSELYRLQLQRAV